MDRYRTGRIAALITSVAVIAAACSSGGSSAAPSAAASAAAPTTAASAAASPAGSAAAGGGPEHRLHPEGGQQPVLRRAPRPAARKRPPRSAASSPRSARRAPAPPSQIPFIQDATTQSYHAIVVSATGADEVAPALKAAKAAGIKVVGYDSSPAEGAYDVFVNQTDFSLIGGSMAQWACDLAPELRGRDRHPVRDRDGHEPERLDQGLQHRPHDRREVRQAQAGRHRLRRRRRRRVSTTQARRLLQSHPDLKVIVAPTTVGILGGRPGRQGGRKAIVKVTGLGLPNDMKAFVADGTSPEFGLWSVPDLGKLAYYVADQLVTGKSPERPARPSRSRAQRRPAVHDRRQERRHPRPALRLQQGQRQRLRLLDPRSIAPHWTPAATGRRGLHSPGR